MIHVHVNTLSKTFSVHQEDWPCRDYEHGFHDVPLPVTPFQGIPQDNAFYLEDFRCTVEDSAVDVIWSTETVPADWPLHTVTEPVRISAELSRDIVEFPAPWSTIVEWFAGSVIELIQRARLDPLVQSSLVVQWDAKKSWMELPDIASLTDVTSTTKVGRVRCAMWSTLAV